MRYVRRREAERLSDEVLASFEPDLARRDPGDVCNLTADVFLSLVQEVRDARAAVLGPEEAS